MGSSLAHELEEVCRRRVGNVVEERYHLVDLLGFGTTGAVYRAENRWVGRTYALKLFHYQGTDQQAVLRRFVREAQAGNRIRREGHQHPNVVQSYDVGRDTNSRQFFIVQELLAGKTLAHHLYEMPGRGMSFLEAWSLLGPVIDAIACAHEAGIVHRDLKPENVFLSRDDDGNVVPKVLDFGIAQLADARMTPTHELLGTPQYMPPEAFVGARSVDARADVWALALILYEMIVGECPFESDGEPIVIMNKIRSVHPVSLVADGHVSPQVWSILQRALSKDPALRQSNARELFDAIDGATGNVRVLRVPARVGAEELQQLLRDKNSRLQDSRHIGGRNNPGDDASFSMPPPDDPAGAFWSVEFLSTGHTADEMLAILALPELERVVELHIVGNELGDDGFRRLVGSTRLLGVSTLVLRRVGLAPDSLMHLAGCPHANGLTRLDLEDNVLDAESLALLLRAPMCPSLRTLSLVKTSLDDNAVAAFFDAPHLAGLTRLDLSQNKLTDAGLERLSNAPKLSPELWLGLARNALGPRAQEIAKALRIRVKKLVL